MPEDTNNVELGEQDEELLQEDALTEVEDNGNDNMTATVIMVDDFTVQYFMKDKVTDKPKFGPLVHYKAELTINVNSELSPFLKTYCLNASNDDQIPYDAKPNLVKKWRRRLKESNPEYFDRKKVSADEIIDGAISCSIEDDIKDALEECWDDSLAPMFHGSVPVPPPNYKIGGRYIHLYKWHVPVNQQ